MPKTAIKCIAQRVSAKNWTNCCNLSRWQLPGETGGKGSGQPHSHVRMQASLQTELGSASPAAWQRKRKTFSSLRVVLHGCRPVARGLPRGVAQEIVRQRRTGSRAELHKGQVSPNSHARPSRGAKSSGFPNDSYKKRKAPLTPNGNAATKDLSCGGARQDQISYRATPGKRLRRSACRLLTQPLCPKVSLMPMCFSSATTVPMLLGLTCQTHSRQAQRQAHPKAAKVAEPATRQRPDSPFSSEALSVERVLLAGASRPWRGHARGRLGVAWITRNGSGASPQVAW